MFIGSCLFPILTIFLLISTSEARCFVNNRFCSRKARKVDYNKGKETSFTSATKTERIYPPGKSAPLEMPGDSDKQTVVSKIRVESNLTSVQSNAFFSERNRSDVKTGKKTHKNRHNSTIFNAYSLKHIQQKRNKQKEHRRKHPSHEDKGSVHVKGKKDIYSHSSVQQRYVSIPERTHTYSAMEGSKRKKSFSHIVFNPKYKKVISPSARAVLYTNNGNFNIQSQASARRNYTRRNKSTRELKLGNPTALNIPRGKENEPQNELFGISNTNLIKPYEYDAVNYLEGFNKTKGIKTKTYDYQTDGNYEDSFYSHYLPVIKTKPYELSVDENDHFIDTEKYKNFINTPLEMLTSAEHDKMLLPPWISKDFIRNRLKSLEGDVYSTDSIFLPTTQHITAAIPQHKKTAKVFRNYPVLGTVLKLKDFLTFSKTDDTLTPPTQNNNLKGGQFSKIPAQIFKQELTSTVYPLIYILPVINVLGTLDGKNDARNTQKTGDKEYLNHSHITTGRTAVIKKIQGKNKVKNGNNAVGEWKEGNESEVVVQTSRRISSALETENGTKNYLQKHKSSQNKSNLIEKYSSETQKLEDAITGKFKPYSLNSTKADTKKTKDLKSGNIRSVVQTDVKQFHPTRDISKSNGTVSLKLKRLLTDLKKLLLYSKANLKKLQPSGRKESDSSSGYTVSANDFREIGKSTINEKQIQYEFNDGNGRQISRERKAVDTLNQSTEATDYKNEDGTLVVNTILKAIFGILGFAFICALTASIYFTAIKYTSNHKSAKSEQRCEDDPGEMSDVSEKLPSKNNDDEQGFYDQMIENKHRLKSSLCSVLKIFKPFPKIYLEKHYSTREHVTKIRNAMSGIIK